MGTPNTGYIIYLQLILISRSPISYNTPVGVLSKRLRVGTGYGYTLNPKGIIAIEHLAYRRVVARIVLVVRRRPSERSGCGIAFDYDHGRIVNKLTSSRPQQYD